MGFCTYAERANSSGGSAYCCYLGAWLKFYVASLSFVQLLILQPCAACRRSLLQKRHAVDPSLLDLLSGSSFLDQP